MRNPILACALLALVGACSSPEPAPPTNTAEAVRADAPAPPAVETPAAVTANAATIGGDGSPIELAPLRPDDAAELSGELACSFAAEGAKESLMLARADVADDAHGRAVIRIGDYTEVMVTKAGGFNAMEKGGAFSGRGMTLTLAREARVPDASEAVRYRATLRVQRADGAERVYPGLWTCGP